MGDGVRERERGADGGNRGERSGRERRRRGTSIGTAKHASN